MSATAIGIVSKVVLVVVITQTTHWTVCSTALTLATVAIGLMTTGLGVVGLLRSGGDWMHLAAMLLGLITAAPVLGYSA